MAQLTRNAVGTEGLGCAIDFALVHFHTLFAALQTKPPHKREAVKADVWFAYGAKAKKLANVRTQQRGLHW